MAEAKENVEREARKILGIAIQRYAADQCVETVVAAVELPSDDMKGRIIGREGRNIRAFEKATGLDVVVDDTPGVVVISGFDGVRREMARRAMEKLVRDGRIHPARIEEVVEQTKKEMEQVIVDTGKEAPRSTWACTTCTRWRLECLGRLKFRTSYGQNQLQHSMEVAHLAGTMAAELGLDVQLAKRCGLLHDIGKSVDQEVEGSHPQIGADIARKCGEPTGGHRLHRRASRRHHRREHLRRPGERGGRHIRGASRRAARDAGKVRQAPAAARRDRRRLPRRGGRLRHPRRSRGARDRHRPTAWTTRSPRRCAATSPRRSRRK